MKFTYVDLNVAKSNPPKGEVLTSDTQTEQSGYIDPKRQIEDMILAGRRLDEARKSQFDFPSGEEIDEDLYDPTRSGNFDLSDASQMQFEANERIKADKASKASQTAQTLQVASKSKRQGVTYPASKKGLRKFQNCAIYGPLMCI